MAAMTVHLMVAKKAQNLVDLKVGRSAVLMVVQMVAKWAATWVELKALMSAG